MIALVQYCRSCSNGNDKNSSKRAYVTRAYVPCRYTHTHTPVTEMTKTVVNVRPYHVDKYA